MSTHLKVHRPTRAMKRAIRMLPPLRLIADRPAPRAPQYRASGAT